ncbi:MAG: aminotransferase class I/II-fold pyridoxal phosphate-dependent enzyme [Clostridia bacterium]|nr:aminotransferase class I/II-fold pyridoxal phosphate-dependent enzyme [Clostridia bacterium]MBQ4608018.1 aminotransferase class I/II-fold pyridoxal phosphate-dependent enzyme [Clostridia bacterium]MBQ7051872.1 aminotransferase class I/II-fold pyridoxal phosphate-dependent enzyme [Clostridia bacterium]
MNFSHKLDAFEASIFTELLEAKLALRAKGMDTIDLSIGTPDLPPPEHVMRAISEAAMKPENYIYAVKDRPQLLETVRSWYKRRFDVELDAQTQIVSLLGSQDGLAHLTMALCDPGDVVLVPDPCYPIFADGPRLNGCDVHYMAQPAENGYVIDFDRIDPELAGRAKLMVVSYPNNPVASVADEHFYEKLVAFAKKYDIAVLHDNAYSDLTFDDYTCGSFLRIPGAMDVGIEFNSLSKTYSMAGARIGFALGNREMIKRLKSLKSNIDFGCFIPVQLGAEAALNGPQDYIQFMRSSYQRRRDVLIDGLAEAGWVITKPKATMFVWAKIPQGYESARAFAYELMEKTGVICVPGTAFGPCGEGHVRMALVQPEQTLAEAVRRIAASGMIGRK